VLYHVIGGSCYPIMHFHVKDSINAMESFRSTGRTSSRGCARPPLSLNDYVCFTRTPLKLLRALLKEVLKVLKMLSPPSPTNNSSTVIGQGFLAWVCTPPPSPTEGGFFY